MKFISPKKAAELLSVTTNSLRTWEIENKITSIKTIGGHRRYALEDILKLLDKKNNPKTS